MDPIGTIEFDVDVDTVRITMTGDIDARLREELEEAIRVVRSGRLPVTLDATGVTFMDSHGARFIGRCYTHGPLTVSASEPVRFLLQILAMDEVLEGRQ